ncbi:hypothetical protein AVEN_149781-2-1, partial [Araneus ventricosus]
IRRLFGDGPRNFKLLLDDEDDTRDGALSPGFRGRDGLVVQYFIGTENFELKIVHLVNTNSWDLHAIPCHEEASSQKVSVQDGEQNPRCLGER